MTNVRYWSLSGFGLPVFLVCVAWFFAAAAALQGWIRIAGVLAVLAALVGYVASLPDGSYAWPMVTLIGILAFRLGLSDHQEMEGIADA